jgi:hypothetical protein
MRPSQIVAATALATLAAASSVPAQTTPERPSKPAAVQPGPALSAKPYSRLFAQTLPGAGAALRSTTLPNSARNFLCVTPVLPTDPSIDPTFEMRPPDRTTRFSMRIVPLPACR